MIDEEPRSKSDASVSLDELISRCALDVTAQVRSGRGRKIYGRDAELSEVMSILAAPVRHNPILLGRPGVGKSAIVQELAARFIAGDCPRELQGLRVIAVTPKSILTGFGMSGPRNPGWRELLPQFLEMLQNAPNILLALRDAHEAPGAGMPPSPDVADFLTPLLTSGGLRCLAEGRADIWKRAHNWDPNFAGAFVPVNLTETDPAQTGEIVNQVCADLEVEYGLIIPAETRSQAQELTGRFMAGRAQPGKTVELLEETLSSDGANLVGKELTRAAVIHRFGQRTGLPLFLLDDQEPFDEDTVQHNFSSRVLGQDVAVASVCRVLSLIKSALNDPQRPMGVFLWLGPTGVGKTELARTLASFLFGSSDRLVRFNMADYATPYDVDVLFGDADTNYAGHLTDRLAGQSFAVVLLDEFEKANPAIFQRFLQMFDEGQFINAQSVEIDMRNTIIIMTSNFGARLVQHDEIGFQRIEPVEQVEARILRETERYFSPEFINRIDAVTFFKPLSKETMRQIAYREIESLLRRGGIRKRRLNVEYDEAVVNLVVEQGYSEKFGARYLRRQIEKSVTYPLARVVAIAPKTTDASVRLYVRRGQIDARLLQDEASGMHTEGMILVDTLEAGGQPSGKPLTLEDVEAALPHILERIQHVEAVQQIALARAEVNHLLAEMAHPSFWDVSVEAESKLARLGELSQRVDLVGGLRAKAEETQTLIDSVRRRNDKGNIPTIVRLYRSLTADLPRAELDLLFTSPTDPHNAWLQIEAIGEGEERAGWIAELARMYQGWAKGREFTVEVAGDAESDDLRIVLKISGHGASGLLKGEAGTHRLLLASDAGRKAVLAHVNVWPEVEGGSDASVRVEGEAVKGKGALLRRLRSRASARHPASGLKVSLSSELPVDENKALAVALLHAQLAARRASPQPTLAPEEEYWGGVVRLYHRDREQFVRDTRTRVVVSSVRKVLAGAIDPFLETYLRQLAEGKK